MADRSDIAPYLRGPTIGLRAPRLEDAEHAAAWFGGAVPVSEDRARSMLLARETSPWGNDPTLLLIAESLPSGEIVGSVRLERFDDRIGHLAPTAADAAVRASLIAIVAPWAVDELDLMLVRLDLADDDLATIAVARQIGFATVVRRREAIGRPGGRLDLLTLELQNPRWEWVLERESP